MPNEVKQRSGKWRVYEAGTNKLTRNKAGTPIDGGGFKSKTGATRQANAVNAKQSKSGKGRAPVKKKATRKKAATRKTITRKRATRKTATKKRPRTRGK